MAQILLLFLPAVHVNERPSFQRYDGSLRHIVKPRRKSGSHPPARGKSNRWPRIAILVAVALAVVFLLLRLAEFAGRAMRR
jgi:hypothetical protein